MSHFKTVCECGKTIAQCRCANKDKIVTTISPCTHKDREEQLTNHTISEHKTQLKDLGLNQFQLQSSTTAIYGDVIDGFDWDQMNENLRMAYRALGLNGEAGEVADEIKKIIRNDRGVVTDKRKDKIKLELGDVLWYVAAIASAFNLTLEEVAQANIEKLKERKARGFGG